MFRLLRQLIKQTKNQKAQFYERIFLLKSNYKKKKK